MSDDISVLTTWATAIAMGAVPVLSTVLCTTKVLYGRWLAFPWTRYARVPPDSTYSGGGQCSCLGKRIDNYWRDYCADCGLPKGTKRGGMEEF